MPVDADDFQRGIFEDIEESMPTLTAPVEGPQVPLPEPDASRSTPAEDAAALSTSKESATTVELLPVPQEYERQLEPRNMTQAKELAQLMFQSRLFSAWGTPAAVLATILAGRELGLSAMASLRGFHQIDGKPAMAADLMRALVVRSGRAKYFICAERTPDRCTFETHRDGDPRPVSLTYTIGQAQNAWQKDDRAWRLSGWARHPEDMLAARASSKLARLVYSDILAGLYSPEELD